MKPRILLTGKNGQVGRELDRILASAADLRALGREELDLTRAASIRQAIRDFRPHIVLNAAAYTAVDKAESEEPVARAVNAEAPEVMAAEAKKIGATVIHYSTDYVFDGSKGQPYSEGDPTNPLSAYGRTKLAGEEAVQEAGGSYLILRTAWVYATHGKNFLLTVLRLASEREELRIVKDQTGAPTWSREIARATATILLDEWQRSRGAELFADRAGIYHMTAAGQASWFDFACAIVDAVRGKQRLQPWLATAMGARPLTVKQILPIATKDYPTPARRPVYSVLSNERMKRTFGVELPDWRIQLQTALGLEETA